jgi:hypothetical protein
MLPAEYTLAQLSRCAEISGTSVRTECNPRQFSVPAQLSGRVFSAEISQQAVYGQAQLKKVQGNEKASEPLQ